MGKNNYILFALVVVSNCLFAKGNPGKYIVYFKDKPTNVDVTKLFNENALQKREKYNIPFDERDYPVSTTYIEHLRSINADIINTSNWLNAVLVSLDENTAEQILELPFVASMEKVEKTNAGGIASATDINACEGTNEIQDYEDNFTNSFPQTQLLNGQYLHEQGFSGENMTIAVCDNGFQNANTIAAFTQVFSDNRILGTYDYVHGDSLVYDEGTHGLSCFSFIGGLKDNQYIGTATKSNFYLFHTEDNSGERIQEEFNLAAALERCTQLGVDVVSISLGYFIFNNEPQNNYDTTDTKTNNTIGAKAVNMASSKGLLVCVAAGNSDNGLWVTSPACADSALAVASVNINGVPAISSSVGIPGDLRIKPNVAAVGVNPWYFNYLGQLTNSNGGTSFATPQIAGLSACLWQAFPAKTNWEIKTAIEQSASQYLTPDKKIGYGIPDFQKAYNLLATPTFVTNKSLENEISVYPNPFQSGLNIVCQSNLRVENILVMNNVGQTIYSVNRPAENTLALNDLPKGMYLLQIETDKGMLIKKIIKD
ncbi:MAG: S8 family peptidase [Sphingobacteriales bacterium]|nr:S8 family peptidase [Sphingobacteriales bacterium]